MTRGLPLNQNRALASDVTRRISGAGNLECGRGLIETVLETRSPEEVAIERDVEPIVRLQGQCRMHVDQVERTIRLAWLK